LAQAGRPSSSQFFCALVFLFFFFFFFGGRFSQGGLLDLPFFFSVIVLPVFRSTSPIGRARRHSFLNLQRNTPAFPLPCSGEVFFRSTMLFFFSAGKGCPPPFRPCFCSKHFSVKYSLVRGYSSSFLAFLRSRGKSSRGPDRTRPLFLLLRRRPLQEAAFFSLRWADRFVTPIVASSFCPG